ncbi:NAD(P)H-dependent oxidoreductase [Methylobacter sp. BBA5.1]|uniref:NAD(P)H-dependent oxidoreductase n=1 Tax=Methylobacter sp. BBA5.1 TaxID=1495064 RepID=UPI00056A55BC|nr:NAD(P)H-dependent oxidoreductase [Methylobacter sp. BBA5.1]
MATKQIAIIQGHPDPAGNRFCHALADAYSKGAESSGYEVKVINIAKIEFPILRTQADFDHGQAPEAIKQSQQIIQSANHLVIIYPLWLGTMPAYLKAFFEQVFRPGFAATKNAGDRPWKQLLTGKTAHIVITMGMPAFAYRWYFMAHSLKSLERNILGFCGIKTTQETLIGMVEAVNNEKRQRWLDKMELSGRAGK